MNDYIIATMLVAYLEEKKGVLSDITFQVALTLEFEELIKKYYKQ